MDENEWLWFYFFGFYLKSFSVDLTQFCHLPFFSGTFKTFFTVNNFRIEFQGKKMKSFLLKANNSVFNWLSIFAATPNMLFHSIVAFVYCSGNLSIITNLYKTEFEIKLLWQKNKITRANAFSIPLATIKKMWRGGERKRPELLSARLPHLMNIIDWICFFRSQKTIVHRMVGSHSSIANRHPNERTQI